MANRIAAWKIGVITLLPLCLSACIDEARLRQIREDAVRQAEANYKAGRVSEANALATAAPCCDSLANVRNARELQAETPYQLTLGKWPNTQIIEIDGYRSYYVAVARGASADDSRRLQVKLVASLFGFVDPKSQMPSHDVFAPEVTFLDRNRSRLSTVQSVAQPWAVESGALASFAVPKEAAFAVIHTTARAQSGDSILSYRSSSTGAFPSPLGGAMIVTRSAGNGLLLFPALTGTISLTLK